MPEILSKRVSNYELFFDLAMVLTVGRLTSAFHLEHIGLLETMAFIITNLIILSVWYNEVWYFNKLGDSRRIDIFTLIPLMFIMGNIAITISFNMDKMGAGSQPVILFNSLLILTYAIIILQYYLKGRIVGFTPNIKASMLSGFIVILSLFPFVFGLLGASPLSLLIYLIPLILPLIMRHKMDGREINFPHAVERSQLMTILTFGETVIAIITTYPMTSNLYLGALFFFGMALLFIFYMTQTFLAIEHHFKGPVQALFYAHLPIFIGINLFTVGLEFLADKSHHQVGFYYFLAGIWVFYLGTLCTTYYNQALYRLRRKHYVRLLLILTLGSFVMFLARDNLLLLSLFFIITGWSISRYYMRIRYQLREEQNIPHPDPRQNLKDFS